MRSRSALAADVAIVVVSAAIGFTFLSAALSDRPHTPGEVALQIVVGAVGCVSLWWRRRRPVELALAAIALAVVSTVMWVIGLVLIANVARRRPARLAVPIGVGFWAPNLVTARIWPDPEMTYGSLLLFVGVLVVAALAVGIAGRAREQLGISTAEAADRDRRALVDATRRAERSRIAGEMHDVLGHRLSLLAMHAGAAEHRLGSDPSPVAGAMQVVREQASLALRDLGDVIGVLRDGAVEPTEDRPQPDLADIPALVEESRRAGMDVDLTMTPSAAPTAHGRHAYRVLQEALTNARKHAPGTPVTVAVDVTDRRVRIDVVNPTAAATTPGALLAMRERVELTGGTLAHRVHDGLFQVTAELPLDR